MINRRYRFSRGQALVESMLFMPLMLVALLGLIFFSRLGVLSERAETAVRYGDEVSFRGGKAYTVAAVQQLLNNVVFNNSSSQLLGLCLAPGRPYAAPSPQATGVAADIKAALYQGQMAPGATGTPAPTAKPFFQPDAISQPSCSPGTVNLNGASPSGGNYKYSVGSLPLSLTTFSITADVNIPSYLGPMMHLSCPASSNPTSSSCSSTTADVAFINVAAPTTLLTCVSGLNVLLTLLNPAATAPTCQ